MDPRMKKREAAIVGIGRTAYSRHSGVSTLALAREATFNALADAGLSVQDVDGMTTFAVDDSVSTAQLAYSIGLEGLYFHKDTVGGGNVAAEVVADAFWAVEAGAADCVVVYRALNSRSGKRFGTYADPVAGQAPGGNVLRVPGDDQFLAPHGYMVPGQWYALWTRRHFETYGTTNEDLGAIAVQYRAHAANNPHAVARNPITIEEYHKSRWIMEPFHIFDCALEADGACALVVTTLERARDLKHKPVRMLGHIAYTGKGRQDEVWDDMTTMYSAFVGPRLWDRTGLKPYDMDFACLYDCFTYTALATTEDYGFCEKGEGGRFYREGRATYGGDMVINPHGGLLSEAYIHGLNHSWEAVAQIRGDADARQVKDANICLVSAGAAAYGSAMVLAGD
jgi:acetyl-CoA acetyltransferase